MDVDLKNYIDQTLLKPETTLEQFQNFFKICNEYKFYGACFPSSLLETATSLLLPEIKKIVVIGFPHGNQHPNSKLRECESALELGADEIDMVFNIGFFLSKEFPRVEQEIAAIASNVKSFGKSKLLKVIIESSLLSLEQVEAATKLVGQSGADFIKTSTGFAGGGATLEVVSTMKKFAPPHLKIKASGGIKTRQHAIDFINAGASRLGTSSGMEICSASKLQVDVLNSTNSTKSTNSY
ncbi:MAG: deoxyribose-phosphate aldolase [Bacteriovoracaceae bacterium]|nr:deoxyribose-phosphate aldolase [Bacteriovoracaceae bacterium]